MNLKHFILALVALLAMPAALGARSSEFVKVGPDGQFHIGDSIYRFAGTNFWYGPILASEGPGGDRARLTRELDRMQEMGIDNLRILAGAEAPDSTRHHISPVLQTAPGVYNDDLLRGLDYFMAELEKRNMKAVIYLTNSWEWSGGYGSYLTWNGHGTPPDPTDDGYNEYVDHAAKFVLDPKARQMALDHAKFMVGRVNTVTGKPYSQSPAIMAWQVANEPRAFSKEGKEALAQWISDTAKAIKAIDPNHMVSTGSEGKYGCEIDLDLWTRIHAAPEIDYAIIHLWPTNWGWAKRDSCEYMVDRAIDRSGKYIDEHIAAMKPYGKPLVIEEFGYPRNGLKFAVGTPIEARDKYYTYIFNRYRNDSRIGGINFWGWNGEARPVAETWTPGAPFCCDPAHEPQGFYGVFDNDLSTIRIIRGK